MDSWYKHGLMVLTQTYGIDNTHGSGLDSWYRFVPPESHTYERAECCLHAVFLAARSSSRTTVVRQSVRPSVGPSVRRSVGHVCEKVTFRASKDN